MVGVTCVVALKHKGKVYMGADSCSFEESLSLPVRTPKIARFGPVLIGQAGDWRPLQVLRYETQLPLPTRRKDAFDYVAGTLIPAMREAFKKAGTAGSKDGLDTQPSDFLVGLAGRILYIEDFQVTEPVEPFWAVGSGSKVALGAMFVSHGQSDPRKRILAALGASSRFTPSVCAPFVVESA